MASPKLQGLCFLSRLLGVYLLTVVLTWAKKKKKATSWNSFQEFVCSLSGDVTAKYFQVRKKKKAVRKYGEGMIDHMERIHSLLKCFIYQKKPIIQSAAYIESVIRSSVIASTQPFSQKALDLSVKHGKKKPISLQFSSQGRKLENGKKWFYINVKTKAN